MSGNDIRVAFLLVMAIFATAISGAAANIHQSTRIDDLTDRVTRLEQQATP